MRKAIVGVLSLPVIVASSLAPLTRRPAALRATAVVAILGLLTIAALGEGAPAITAYRTTPADPHAAARLASRVVADFGVHQSVQIDFSTPMDGASVEAALRITPASKLALTWSADGRTLRVAPLGAWGPGRFYTITVDTAAVDLTGGRLAEPVRAIFFTRSRPSVALSLTRTAGGRALPGSALELLFSGPVDPASVEAALHVSPAVAGHLVAASEPGVGGTERFLWVPDAPLEPGTELAFNLAASVRDGEGVTLDGPAHLEATVVGRPTVRRSKPADRATSVDVDQTLSVRFTEKMDRRSTQAAFRVSGLDTAKGGSFRWLEGDTVLVFDPRGNFAYGRKVVVQVLGSARSALGVAAGSDPAVAIYRASFSVRPRPVAGRTSTPSTGGGSTSGTYLNVEQYYLRLLNCTRTGGWVRSDGSCDGYGSGRFSTYVAPLTLSSGISSRVSRPYAKLLATRNICSHYADGGPGDRLRRAGYTNFRWGENIGCRSGNPFSAVLASHLFFQSEKSSSGGHWVNLKDARFSTVGIGVWVASGRVRLVTDFYHP